MDTAKLFQNGKSQAVRLPKEFRFAGKEVYIKRVGKAVVLLPLNNKWQSLLGSLEKFSPNFRIKRQQPKKHERERMFD